MAQPEPISKVAMSTTNIVGSIYREAINPLIEDLAKEMATLIAAKKHYVVHLREAKDFAPNASFVQATLRFHYIREETAAWVDWRKNKTRYTEEPERYSYPKDATAAIVIDGLPGGTITITVRFKLETYTGDTVGVRIQEVNYDWNLGLGTRHLDTTEKFLLSHTLSAAKAKTIKTLVEP